MSFADLRPNRSNVGRAIVDRLKGPGGYYNIGNAVGLVMALYIQISSMSNQESAVAAAWNFFAGSPSAFALTVSTGVFFWSGEAYHRAWANGFPPDDDLNQLGDNLSGVGALALGVSLFLLGQPWLAATAGLLHAAGKFGSAWHRAEEAFPFAWPQHWPDPSRTAVLASRLPAIAAALLELWPAVISGEMDRVLGPATLLVCYLLWSKADLLLFRPSQ
jgi:hypothetical protein